jgi:hypothetical protein
VVAWEFARADVGNMAASGGPMIKSIAKFDSLNRGQWWSLEVGSVILWT